MHKKRMNTISLVSFIAARLLSRATENIFRVNYLYTNVSTRAIEKKKQSILLVWI